MIRVTLELVPGGFGEPQHLGVIYIDNRIMATVKSDGKKGDYGYELKKKRINVVNARGVIRNFPRLSYHPWNLVRQILNEAAEKNGGVI